jgi:hypothetical protein
MTKLPTKPPTTKSKFQVATCDGSGTGEKIILYGESGVGKSTLAMMAPKPIFICVDDGIRKLRHPTTEEPAKFVDGVTTFHNVLDVLSPNNWSLFTPYESVVIDTITMVQHLYLPWLYENVKDYRNNQHVAVERLEDYSYAKGYQHVFDGMQNLLAKLDELHRRNKNVILLAQEGVVIRINPAGEDYMQWGPDLIHTSGKKPISTRDSYCAWADHVCRIGPSMVSTGEIQDRQKKDGYLKGFRYGKALGETERVVHLRTKGVAMKVKSRTAQDDCVPFSEQKDNALWVSIFGQEWNMEAGK